MTLKLFACLALLSAIPLSAQNNSKSIAITDKSNIALKDISKALQKECPDVSIASDVTKSDYTVEAIKNIADPKSSERDSFDLTLFDHDGKTVRSTSTEHLGNAVQDVCHAIKTAVLVEVVDAQNITQSVDERGSGGIVPALTGRRTHTDTSTIYVIAKGEHATLDCYEHRIGCTTIGPGKYYGELDGDSIWVDYDMPLTHKHVRNHYKIAGSW